jgi:hypothetical protein
VPRVESHAAMDGSSSSPPPHTSNAATPIATVLQGAKQLSDETRSAILCHLSNDDALQHWLALLEEERPAMMRAAQRAGVSKLNERQALANALSRAVRTGMLPAPRRPSDVPRLKEVEQAALECITGVLAHIRRVTSSDSGYDDGELRAVGIDASLVNHVTKTGPLDPSKTSDGEAAAEPLITARALLDSLPAGRLTSLLEAHCIPPSHVRQLLADRERREAERALIESDQTRGLRLGFYSNQLCERGTETAMFDYAHFAETLLGVTSYIIYDGSSYKNVDLAVAKFERRFPGRVLALREVSAVEITRCVAEHAISHVYIIKFGAPDSPKASDFRGARTLMHAVFDARVPHGSVFAKISPCVPGPGVPVVPHIVRQQEPHGPDLRLELGIPEAATVFGRYGGYGATHSYAHASVHLQLTSCAACLALQV